MYNEASFSIEDDDSRKGRVNAPNPLIEALPPGLQTAFRAVKALISMATGGELGFGTGGGLQPRNMPPQPAALTEQEWIHLFRQSSPQQVKTYFMRFFSEYQKQALGEAQSAAAALLYYETKMKPLKAERHRLNTLIDLSARTDDEEAGVHYIAKLLDIEEDLAHYANLLQEADRRKVLAHQTQEITHLQLRALNKALERWAELRAGADAAVVREGLSSLHGAMTRMIGQLSDDAATQLSASVGAAQASTAEFSIDLRMRRGLIAEEWRRRRHCRLS